MSTGPGPGCRHPANAICALCDPESELWAGRAAYEAYEDAGAPPGEQASWDVESDENRAAWEAAAQAAIKAGQADPPSRLQPHAYVAAQGDYTNTCQQCGRGKHSYLHQQKTGAT